jgi:hypothetical protein
MINQTSDRTLRQKEDIDKWIKAFKLLTITMLCYIIIELSFKPRIDIAKTGGYIWYGTRKRKCFKLW